MGLIVSPNCEACGKPRQQHSPKQRAICSKEKQKMRARGELIDEKISTPPLNYKLTPGQISCKRYVE